MNYHVTFRSLENNEHITSMAGLDEWYDKVRDVPIEDLDDLDLCRACRQRLFMAQVVPVAALRLQSDPLAGDVFEGELLASMKSIPSSFWQRDPLSGGQVLTIAESLLSHPDNEIRLDAEDIARAIIATSSDVGQALP